MSQTIYKYKQTQEEINDEYEHWVQEQKQILESGIKPMVKNTIDSPPPPEDIMTTSADNIIPPRQKPKSPENEDDRETRKAINVRNEEKLHPKGEGTIYTINGRVVTQAEHQEYIKNPRKITTEYERVWLEVYLVVITSNTNSNAALVAAQAVKDYRSWVEGNGAN